MAWIDKNFEESMTPKIDDIYFSLFKNLEKVIRSNRNTTTDQKILFADKELAIDTFLHFSDGTVLTFQEKSRRFKYLVDGYDNFTFEYYNDPETKEEGEWFKLASQLYFYGFTNKNQTGYIKFCIIDVVKLRLYLKNKIGIKELERRYKRQNKKPNKASFFAIPFDIIPDDCIKFKWESKNLKQNIIETRRELSKKDSSSFYIKN